MRNNYSPHTEERAFIEDDRFSFKEMPGYLKTFSKSVAEVENMTLKNIVLLGGWIVTASKVFRCDKNKNMRGKNLSGRFDDWMLKECKIKSNKFKIMKIFTSWWKLLRK